MQQPGNEDVKVETMKLADLIDYQEGSIVSRTLIDKKVGTLTIFAFDKEQGLSEHTAPFDAFVYVIDGTVDIVISGKACTVGTGEIIIMPANEPHSLKAIEKLKIVLVMIKA